MYLSGRKVTCTENLGVMLSYNANHTTKHGHTLFAADNGCFVQGEKYTDSGFLQWLATLDKTFCLFAVAPDVVGDAAATRDRAYPMLPKIRELGFKAAYVCQDGETPDQILWDELDAIFIGGSTEWKLSQAAADIATHAKKKNKWVHMGRVNSYKRLRYAEAIGCDSCDGTYLAFAPDKNKPKLLGWLQSISDEPLLDLVS